MIDRHAVVLLSGGLDSAVACAIIRHRGWRVTPLFFSYGQLTEARERRCAQRLTRRFGCERLVQVDLPWLRQWSSSSGLVNRSVRLRSNRDWRREYVPFRNTVFLSIATALAETIQAQSVAIGSTGSDHICPDNRPIYHQAMQRVMRLGARKPIRLLTPVGRMSKEQVVATGLRLGVPFEYTWSCHKSTTQPCGRCSNCTSRNAAFRFRGVNDPIQLRRSG